jgi:hypothetical protein
MKVDDPTDFPQSHLHRESPRRVSFRVVLLMLTGIVVMVGMQGYFRTVIIPGQEIDAAINDKPRGNLSDLYPRWLGARAILLEHRSPYSPEVTAAIQKGYWGRTLDPNNPNDPKDEARFAYPLYVVFLLAPTVTLPFDSVQRLYVAAMLALSVFSISLWFRTFGHRAFSFEVALASMLFLGSYPVVQAFYLQQPALLVFGLIAVAVAAASSGALRPAGIVLALAMIKPQSTIPIAGWLLLWALARWKERKALVISFAAAMIAMCAGASLLLPGWVAEWRDGATSYMVYNAGVPSQVQVIFGKYLGGAIGVILCIAVGVLCWKSRGDSPSTDRFKMVPALILVVNMAVTPLWHEYDQMFVLPAVLLIFCWREEFHKLPPFARAVISLSSIVFAWHWVGAILLTIIAIAFLEFAQKWQILPWLPMFFSPMLVLASLMLISWARLQHRSQDGSSQ